MFLPRHSRHPSTSLLSCYERASRAISYLVRPRLRAPHPGLPASSGVPRLAGCPQLIIGTPGAPMASKARHSTVDATVEMPAAAAGSDALLSREERMRRLPPPAPLYNLCEASGETASRDAAACAAVEIFDEWEGQAWLFDLHADPAESTNLLLQEPRSAPQSQAPPAETAVDVGRRLLLRLAAHRQGMCARRTGPYTLAPIDAPTVTCTLTPLHLPVNPVS